MTTTTDLSKMLAERYGLSMMPKQRKDNPNMRDMPAGSRHYTCTLRGTKLGAGPSFSLPFSMGPAHFEPPKLYDVLTCLRSDANMLESGELDSFEHYCDALGMNPDRRADERTYKKIVAAVNANTEALKALLGERMFAVFLADEDCE